MPPPPSRIPTYTVCLVCNAYWRRPTAPAPSPHNVAALKKEGVLDVALLGRASMPLRVGIVRAAEPLAAALAELLSALIAGFIHAGDSLTRMFLRLYGCCSGH